MQSKTTGSLPPLPPSQLDQERKAARERRDAAVRGVASIEQMRAAIKDASRRLPALTEVPRRRRLDASASR